MTELPEITDAVLDQWAESAAADEAAERSWSVHPLAVLAVVGEVKRLRADLAAAELMVRRLADQAVSDEARIAAVEAALNEPSHTLMEAIEKIRAAVLAASPTPTGPELCPECNHEPGCWCPETPTPHGCRTCLATPTEATEETP